MHQIEYNFFMLNLVEIDVFTCNCEMLLGMQLSAALMSQMSG